VRTSGDLLDSSTVTFKARWGPVGSDRQIMGAAMSDSSKLTPTSFVAVGCCLIVLGSGSAEFLGPWHYLFYIGAIGLCILAIVQEARK
jgi:hypothetical protein